MVWYSMVRHDIDMCEVYNSYYVQRTSHGGTGLPYRWKLLPSNKTVGGWCQTCRMARTRLVSSIALGVLLSAENICRTIIAR